ncbi:hypothetical protein FA13DRAFT_13731 [Coprinellus micaceus]|uniref:ARM repeat-containing protein n=1 Tax=Coprinellus micaceus TaxID=71717 RepID=A0A4Y7U1F8_COPMI|nr:hypothetical protein FA13DRAFT_13731 [Coprinellus micaceus]
MISEISASGKGRKLASSLIETLRVSDSKSSEISRALIPHLRDQAPLSRITTLELLSSLNRQYHDRLDLTDLAVGEIVSLAFKDSVDEIRIAAVQLLSALAIPLEGPERTYVLKPTAQLATRLMSLLQSEISRPSVIELLSVMALESPVRQSISLEIMAEALRREGDLSQGYTELLARLVSDGRFGDEGTDKVMLLLASTIITRPNLAQYRFEILTALWCRYGTTVIAPYQVKTHAPEQGTATKPQPEIYLEPKDKATEQLVDWFEFAVFGKHATKHEVKKFLTRSAIWLPALTSESEEVKGHLKPVAEAKEHAELAFEAKKKPEPLVEVRGRTESITEEPKDPAASP